MNIVVISIGLVAILYTAVIFCKAWKDIDKVLKESFEKEDDI